jgi:hypothetical protein
MKNFLVGIKCEDFGKCDCNEEVSDLVRFRYKNQYGVDLDRYCAVFIISAKNKEQIDMEYVLSQMEVIFGKRFTGYNQFEVLKEVTVSMERYDNVKEKKFEHDYFVALDAFSQGMIINADDEDFALFEAMQVALSNDVKVFKN